MRLYIVLFLLFSFKNYAQQRYEIDYAVVSKFTDTIPGNSLSEKQKKNITEALNQHSNKTAKFLFDATFARYEEIDPKHHFSIIDMGVGIYLNKNTSGIVYTDLEQNLFYQTPTVDGKKMKVKDSLLSYDWEIQDSTKTIHGYSVRLAHVRVPISVNSLTNFGLGLHKAYGPKFSIVKAWYTEEIPFGLGPMNYGGLPGLILEMDLGNTKITCLEIKHSDDLQDPRYDFELKDFKNAMDERTYLETQNAVFDKTKKGM
jgi:GLPGLI family protein